MEPSRLRELLGELERRLRAEGVVGGMTVIGGSALALRYPGNPDVRHTRDIDADYWPKEDVERVVREMAAEYKLPPDWLNDNGVPYMPSTSRPRYEQFTVAPVDDRDLVAMKLAGSREQDLRDLEIVSAELKIDDPSELVDIAFERYGQDSILLSWPRSEYERVARDVIRRRKRRTGR